MKNFFSSLFRDINRSGAKDLASKQNNVMKKSDQRKWFKENTEIKVGRILHENR